MRAARLLSVLALSSLLAACPLNELFQGRGSEVIVSMGVLSAAPTSLRFASNAVTGSTQSTVVSVITDVQRGSNGTPPELRMYPLSTLPTGLTATVSMPNATALTDSDGQVIDAYSLVGNGRATTEATVTVTVDSALPIGTAAPGRQLLTVVAYVCVREIADVNGPDEACAEQEIDIAVIVEGAAIPTQPSGLAATLQSRQAFLSWNADPAPDSYRVERAPASGVFTIVATLDAPVTAYTDSGLDPNTAYAYRLTPTNAAGTGPAATIDVLTLTDAPSGNGVLAVTTSGSGGGRVTSEPAGIDCPTDCSETLPLGRSVTLVATPASGSVFESWGGAADCADGIVTVVAELACVAVFSPAPSGSRGWQALGGGVLTSGGQAPVIAADPLGGLYIALRRPIGGFGELIVQRYNGTGWPALGGAAVNAPVGLGATSHGFAIDREGRPVVAWSEFSAVKVARWESDRWNLIAEDLRVATDGTPSQVQLAVRDLALVVAWAEYTAGTLHLRTKSFNGTAWVGGAGLDVPDFTGYRLTLDANGLPAVVVSRAIVGSQQPLRAFRATAFQAQGISWQALASDIPVATGNAFQHEQLGFGVGFTNAGAGGLVVLGTRDTRYAYVKNFNSVAWVPTGQFGVDADGVLADIVPSSGETLRSALMLAAQSVAAILHIAPVSTLSSHRVEIRTLDGLSWVPWTDPLVVDRLSEVTSVALDATGQPVLTTLEGTGGGGLGLVRAYRWVP
jgi:hypothetical protein